MTARPSEKLARVCGEGYDIKPAEPRIWRRDQPLGYRRSKEHACQVDRQRHRRRLNLTNTTSARRFRSLEDPACFSLNHLKGPFLCASLGHPAE